MSLTGKTNLQNVCLLLAAERSGTHFLRSMLANVPSVVTSSEVCNPQAGDIRTAPTSFLKFRANSCIAEEKYFYATFPVQTGLLDNYLNLVRFSNQKRSHIILDVKYSHVHNFHPAWWEIVNRPFLIEYAIERGIKIIHLVREKPYRTVISNMYGQETGVWHARSIDQVVRAKMTIDRGLLKEKAIRLAKTIRLFEGWLTQSNSVAISYEDLVDKTDCVLDRLREFLGLTINIPTQTNFVRSTPPYDQIINNFYEISDLIDVGRKELSAQ